MALVLLAAVSFQCSSTWRWLMGVARHDNQESTDGDVSQQNAIRISHSLPDLQSDPITHEYVQEQKDSKKVKLSSYMYMYMYNHSYSSRSLLFIKLHINTLNTWINKSRDRHIDGVANKSSV